MINSLTPLDLSMCDAGFILPKINLKHSKTNQINSSENYRQIEATGKQG